MGASEDSDVEGPELEERGKQKDQTPHKGWWVTWWRQGQVYTLQKLIFLSQIKASFFTKTLYIDQDRILSGPLSETFQLSGPKARVVL